MEALQHLEVPEGGVVKATFRAKHSVRLGGRLCLSMVALDN